MYIATPVEIVLKAFWIRFHEPIHGYMSIVPCIVCIYTVYSAMDVD